MVSRNYKRLGSSAESMWSDRDWLAAVAAGGALAAGGVAVGSLSESVMDVLFDNSSPTSQVGRTLHGSTKMVLGLSMAALGGMVGMSSGDPVDGYVGQTLAVAGVAGLALGGADLANVVMDLNVLEGFFGSSTASKLRGSSRSSQRRLKSANSRNGQAQRQRTQRQRTPSANQGRGPSAYS